MIIWLKRILSVSILLLCYASNRSFVSYTIPTRPPLPLFYSEKNVKKLVTISLILSQPRFWTSQKLCTIVLLWAASYKFNGSSLEWDLNQFGRSFSIVFFKIEQAMSFAYVLKVLVFFPLFPLFLFAYILEKIFCF